MAGSDQKWQEGGGVPLTLRYVFDLWAHGVLVWTSCPFQTGGTQPRNSAMTRISIDIQGLRHAL
jgi:hypothetical protein